jgi:hypothetical protein
MNDQSLGNDFGQFGRGGGDQTTIHQLKFTAFRVDQTAAGLSQDGRSTRHIPTMDSHFVVSVTRSFGNVTNVESSAAKLTNAVTRKTDGGHILKNLLFVKMKRNETLIMIRSVVIA